MNGFEPRQFGKYYLIEKVAVGGMAEIYKAKTFGVDGFEKQLAIKRILPHCAADKDFITMLIDEAKLSVLLSHANIVQVFDLGKIGDDYFIAMEYIHGINLRDIMYCCRETQKPIPPEIAVYIISEVCKGLDYAHRKTKPSGEPLNIVHRDVSPQNVLLSYEGEVKIVDFGIAKAAMNISHTMAGILKGKIAYMSPEQAMGKGIDSRTDIFSSGILLYEALTNSKLFTGESQFEVLKKIRTSKIEANKLPPSIPDALKPIVAKALAYKPEDRYQNAGDLQIDLTKYLYSTYVDFSPRKLASFIKETFGDELKGEQVKRAKATALESQTASMDVEEGAKQVDIVHREESITPLEGTAEIPKPKKKKKKLLETMVTPTEARVEEEEEEEEEEEPTEKKAVRKAVPRKKKPRRWPRIAATLIFLAAVSYAAYKFIPFAGIWEKIAPREAVEAVGHAAISSIPEGAKIIINGKNTGLKTPADVRDLDLNKTYKLRLEKENYKSAETTIKPTSDKPLAVNLSLEGVAGTINIISEPPGAAILVDGKTIGKVTPYTIESLDLNKDLKLTLSKPDYDDFEQVINLKSTTPQKISTKLTPVVKTGSLSITSTPKGALIALDDKDTGKKTPATIEDLALNKEYDVKLTLKGYEPWTKTLNLTKPEKIDVSSKLKKEVLFGSARVTSSPSGANILLDGKSTGKRTPATLNKLKVGKSYTIGLNKPDYKAWSKRINIASAKRTSVRGSLKSTAPTREPTPTKPAERRYKPEPEKPLEPVITSGKPGSIRIASKPSGAQVFVNKQFKGTTPITVSVPPGTASVVVNKEGFARYSDRVTVRPGQKVNLTNIKLGGLYGDVSLSSTPPRATVTFDGQTIPAKTPVTVRKVRTDRRHTISISMPGYKTWSTSFSMGGGSKNFNVVLEPQ